MKSWREIIALASGYLKSKGVPDAEVAAELLAARLLRCGRGFLAPHLSACPAEKYLEAMRRGISRLVQGEPIQYVLGEWDFRRLTLTCDSRALIPRPETEELVTRVLTFLKKYDAANPPLILDVGTGSGCIALSIADECPIANVVGIDISPQAIQLATANAQKCNLSQRVRFVVADGLDEIDEPESIDVIVSNPPYITTADCAKLDPRIRKYEPLSALDGGETGLIFYERFLADAMNLLKNGGGIFFEIGDSQGPALSKMFFDYGFDDIHIEKDFAGHDRYAFAVMPSEKGEANG